MSFQGITIFIKKLKQPYHLCFEFFLLLCRLINSIQYIQSLLGFVKAIKAVSFLKAEFNVYPVKGKTKKGLNFTVINRLLVSPDLFFGVLLYYVDE